MRRASRRAAICRSPLNAMTTAGLGAGLLWLSAFSESRLTGILRLLWPPAIQTQRENPKSASAVDLNKPERAQA